MGDKKNNLFFNRELSWVEFNGRVLDQAFDPGTPLLEKFKFLAIYANNLDEFFMIRVAGVHSQVSIGLRRPGPSGLVPQDVLSELSEKLVSQQGELYRCFHSLRKELEKKTGIHLISSEELKEEDLVHLKQLFKDEYESLLTPMGLDQSRPFPFIKGKSLFIILTLLGEREGVRHQAVIPVPSMTRLVAVPGRKRSFILLEEIIKLFAHRLFHGYSVEEAAFFRVTRDADLDINEEEVADLLSALESQLRQRERGDVIRLETSGSISAGLLELLKEKLGFQDNRFYLPVDGPLDLTFLFGLPALTGQPDLVDEPLPPLVPSWFPEARVPGELYSILQEKDRWLHLPFESFEPVTAFIEESADDERVLAIKMTLYRTSGRSRFVAALKKAAYAGKQVTVLVELKARFDEAQNITWAKELERAGCHVVYGLVGMKIHSKMTLVIRRGEAGIERFVHLSTGNYNEKTANLYTDIGFFTARKRYGKEVAEVFNVLTGFSEPPRWKTLICAPLDLRDYVISLIDREMENVKAGGVGRIWGKMNSLIDCQVIEKLYDASRAGVEIDLLVRGMCRLIPGIPGMSETIRVTSLVGRYLEHSRVYHFYNQGENALFLSSADWMERNLDRRVEVLFPVKDEGMCREILAQMELYKRDNRNTYRLLSDGSYEKQDGGDDKKEVQAQREIYRKIAKRQRKAQKDSAVFRVAEKKDD